MGSKIKKLEATSFKRLKSVAIEVEAGQSVIRIGGQNATGKSSVLDAIAGALGGEKLCPEEPIRRGETQALARVTLDDGLVAERRWERLRDGRIKTKLEVRAPDGRALPSPQGVLDKLLGRLSFDPEAFARAEPKKQLELLRAVTGINLAEHDNTRADLYARRTEINRELKAAESALQDLWSLPPPCEPVSVADLLDEQRRALAAVEQRRELERKAKGSRDTVAQLDVQIGDLERRLLQAQADRKRLAAAADGYDAELLMLPDSPDLGGIQRRILEAQTINEENAARQRKLDERAARTKLRDELATEAKKLSNDIEAIDAEKATILAEAKLPIGGLGFGEAGVTFNGLPLEQASSAEKLRVSMAMGLALNPQLRVVQIRNASLLDETSLGIVQAMAEEAGAQVWLELVGRAEGAIIIDDGQVEGAEVAAAPAARRPNLGRGTVEEQIAEGRKLIVEVTDA